MSGEEKALWKVVRPDGTYIMSSGRRSPIKTDGVWANKPWKYWIDRGYDCICVYKGRKIKRRQR